LQSSFKMKDFCAICREPVRWMSPTSTTLFAPTRTTGCLLVNGNPALINVDALDALPQSSMHRDPAYISLLAQYPKISIWPGDRSGKVDPVVVEILPDRTQRFIVHYRLRDGCHACAQIGQASFGFEFDRNGRFLQAEYFGIRAMDLKTAQSTR